MAGCRFRGIVGRMNGQLEILPVGDARGRRRFLEFPYRKYKGHPHWVPPLRRSQARLFRKETSFFQRADMQLFLAARAGRVVGRVAAIINRAHNDHYADRMGFFGFFECEDEDVAAAQALLAAAADWLKQQGMTDMRGPFSPSMNSECGLLIMGFDSPPMILMPYTPPAYPALLEAAGFHKEKDLYAYEVQTAKMKSGTRVHARLSKLVERMQKRYPEVTVRKLDMARYEEEILQFMHVFEEARRGNWGYVPVREEEFLETAREMKRIVDPRIVVLAEVNGEPAGVTMSLPNVNRALRGLNGRLLPFNIFRFLHRLKHLRECRIFGIASLEKFRHMGITSLLLMQDILWAVELGYNVGEASWVLEDNIRSSRTIEHGLDPVHYKTYRIYRKSL